MRLGFFSMVELGRNQRRWERCGESSPAPGMDGTLAARWDVPVPLGWLLGEMVGLVFVQAGGKSRDCPPGLAGGNNRTPAALRGGAGAGMEP